MRFQHVIMMYFVIGAVMWGGGAVDYQDAGVAKFFVNVNDGDITPDDSASVNLNNVGGTIQTVIGAAIGGLQIFWNLVVGFLTFMHWPLIVLSGANAPPSVTALLGGGFVAAFYLSFAGMVVGNS